MANEKDNLLDYDNMVQDALRGVVRSVLQKVIKIGLPGDHHFYIAFRTDHPGVRVPDHLRARYPEEITIVMQHQYWDLKVLEDHFELSLSFNQKPEHLVVPFEALSGFMDPSVQFGLQLQPSGAPAKQTSPLQTSPLQAAPLQPPHTQTETEPTAFPQMDPQPAQAEETAEQTSDTTPDEEPSSETPVDGHGGGDNVVTLDVFRKNAKT